MTGDNKTDSELAENEFQLETSMMHLKRDCQVCIHFFISYLDVIGFIPINNYNNMCTLYTDD